ncbi:AraC family transcriptional regulator [Streptomyces sp. NPDC019990]|uniref:AraC family transcriptional regulator n=1 Tax=Streptomyces sp. NPDC019990 TaxID=3154693 RepID=UPI0033F496A7
MTDRLAQAITDHRDGPWTTTAVPRLSLVATDELLPPSRLLYEPMVSFVAAGAKHTVAGSQSWSVPGGQMLLNTVQLPVTAIFEQVPYRSAVLALDKQIITELLLELGPAAPPPAAEPAWRATAGMPAELIDAVTRLVRLLDAPDDIPALAPRVESEIIYRLLTGPLGPALRQAAAADPSTRIRSVITWLGDRFTEPVSIGQIAAEAGMSPATLHRHFKAATGMSPLRYQKHLRLLSARRQLLAGDVTAAQVAHTVGYTSTTQFSREYRAFYGLPPVQDITRLRAGLTPRRAA